MKVVEWIDYDAASERDESVGGMGGWFDNGHRWNDYIANWNEDRRPYLEAIKASVLERNRFIGGDDHQNDEEGVPLFEDGTVALFSYRGWGDLMAAIATEKDGKDHTYMDFYMGCLMSDDV